MREMMYGTSSAVIAFVLFLAIVVAIEVGRQIGRAASKQTSAPPKEHVSGIQAALLGMLALLLGFTLSLSLQRFDGRSAAVVEEANAIGTAYLRADFLPLIVRDDAKRLFRSYVDLRIQAGAASDADYSRRSPLLKKANDGLNALWALANKAVTEDPSPVRTGLFVQALNDAIDSAAKREAALDRHVPEVVLLLMFATFLMGGLVVGYSSGLGGYRAFFATYVMVGLMVVLVFIIVDLDRPRRGLIQVSQASMTELRDSMNEQAPKPLSK
ncbi:hypothetical protein [Pseudorhodoplanes sp.]|uniref:bestrophin-like domain n=1 Tax=Pseudorhodoplanes sp. TaxID=1934341 RepID=UPI003D10929A